MDGLAIHICPAGLLALDAAREMRIYIAGPISSLILRGITPPELQFRFDRGANTVRAMGHEPVIPPNLTAFEQSWSECMKQDIPVLLTCDGIYLMNGWKESKGCQLERQIAEALGLVVAEENV